MSTKHLIIRVFKGNYSGFDQAFDSAILEGILQCFLFPSLLNHPDFTFEWTDLARGSLAAFFITVGRILIAEAISVGIAGPAQALMSTHALHQALWTATFANQPLSPL